MLHWKNFYFTRSLSLSKKVDRVVAIRDGRTSRRRKGRIDLFEIDKQFKACLFLLFVLKYTKAKSLDSS